MKKYSLTIILLAIIPLQVQAAVVWCSVSGKNQFCPTESRESTYTIDENMYDIDIFSIIITHGQMKDPETGQWITSYFRNYRPSWSSFQVRWDEGNFDDAEISLTVQGYWALFQYLRWDNKKVKLIQNVGTSPNVEPTISSSVSNLACGSTSSLTFTASWKNANSYNWEAVTGGAISGSSTGTTITVIPSNGTTDVTVRVRGYNSACNVYSPWKYHTVARSAPVVNEITGPGYVCYGAPSVLNHYVNNISGVAYTWSTVPPGNLNNSNLLGSSIYVNASTSGQFTLKLTAIGCGAQIERTKTVTATNSTPTPPYISQYPGTHCAGSCATYYTQIPNGFVIENQFRYNYGTWDVANSYGAMYICTQSYDTGYKSVELRSKGICGTYGPISTQSINISNCGYMMVTSAEDSLALAEMSGENDLAMYPNPSTTTMTISLPDDMQETQVTVLSDQGEVIATFDNAKAMFTINTAKLQRGNYFLSVADKIKKLTKRFVVE